MTIFERKPQKFPTNILKKSFLSKQEWKGGRKGRKGRL